jgi:hypothetical protein
LIPFVLVPVLVFGIDIDIDTGFCAGADIIK